MNLKLAIGKKKSQAERLGQAAELQKYLRGVANGEGADAAIDVEIKAPRLEGDAPSAESVLEILSAVADILAETEDFDREVSVLPVENIWAGTEGFSVFWTPKGGDEVRGNITAVVNPPIKTLYACGDPERLVEMEADPDWVPRHDPKTMKLRYADYAGKRMVEFPLSTVRKWICEGRISQEELSSCSTIP